MPSSKPPKCQNHNFDKIMQKKEIIFVYLPNTSHFMHFQSVRQKKGNIHNKTNEYRWYFRSKPHQTTLKVLSNNDHVTAIHFGHFAIFYVMISPTSPPLPRRPVMCYYDVMRYTRFSRVIFFLNLIFIPSSSCCI